MTTDQTEPVADAASSEKSGRASANETVRKDMSYSPASETETEGKQSESLSGSIDDDIDASAIKTAPGTGGPDDAGDIEVDPDDLNMPGQDHRADR